MASYIHVDPKTPGLNTVRGDEFGAVLEYTVVASATEERAIMLRNATASGIRATILDVEVALESSTTGFAIVKAYLNPNMTATGTSSTGINFNLGASASSIKVHVSSTGTSTGTRIPASVEVSNTKPFAKYCKPIVLNAAQDLLFTVTGSIATSMVEIKIRWYEETVA